MTSEEFKAAFSQFAHKYGFEKAFSGWFKEGPECMVVLDLQRSNYSLLYYLNIKIYVQGLFGNTYTRSKALVKVDVGDIFTRQPEKYNQVFDLENSLADVIRLDFLRDFFEEYLIDFSERALTIRGLKELETEKEIYILPAVEKYINR